MQKEPIRAYIYQPEPANSTLFPRIYGVSGPGTELYDQKRMTKQEADYLVGLINGKSDLTEKADVLIVRST